MSSIRERTTDRFTRQRLRLEISRARGPFAVIVILFALGVTSIAFMLSTLQIPLPWQKRYEVRVQVADAKGVVKNNDVRISGVVVGRITGVGLEQGRAVVTARIDPKYAPLYRDARLRLRPRTPLEDMYINVEKRGTRQAGEVPSGGLLRAERTQTPVHIGQVLDVFDADVRPRMKAAIDNLGRGLGDHGDEFRMALTELAPFLESARRLARETAIRRQQTRRLVHNFALMNEELAHRNGQVTRLVTAGATALTELGSVDRPLSDFIAQTPAMLRKLPESFATLRAAADELDPAFDALQPVARAMPSGLRSLSQLAPDLRGGAAALRRPMPRLTSLMRATAPLSEDLDRAFAGLRPQMPRLDHATADIVPCELALGDFFQWTISIGKFADVGGALPRGQTVLGTHNTGGLVKDPELTSGTSCAKGGPRK